MIEDFARSSVIPSWSIDNPHSTIVNQSTIHNPQSSILNPQNGMMISVRLLLRHLAAIVALPVTVVVAIPVWIAERNPLTFTTPHSLSGAALLVCGAALLAVGFALFGASVRYFWSRGRHAGPLGSAALLRG
jgi:hypothetical protein